MCSNSSTRATISATHSARRHTIRDLSRAFVDPLEIGKSVRPNPFFPLVPGSQWIYASPLETVTVDVLGKSERIAGVPCTVVHDVVKHNGQTIEDTLDWFAQNIDGSVWYCGEQSEELLNGRVVDIGGSWRAGTDEARPGIIMQAVPHVGDTYRQEFALGEAEDAATIRSTALDDGPGGVVRQHLLVTGNSHRSSRTPVKTNTMRRTWGRF